jgi:DNA-directed RNA polymerase subunit RPC12/RpoP
MMNTPQSFTVSGKPLHCQHCSHRLFFQQQAQLNTAFLSLINLDWLNRSADIYVCERCGFLHWFLGSLAEEDALDRCLACDARLLPNNDTCPTCGWSYRSATDTIQQE